MMTLRLLGLILAGVASTAVAVADDAAVVAEFKTFADQENVRLRAHFTALAGTFIVDPVGNPIPLTLPRKYQFTGIQLEAAPETFSYDIRRTDSLISPYAGHLEWPVVFLRATTHAKGPAEFCNRQPFKSCVDHGGQIFETDMLYKNSAERIPKSVRYDYVYQDGQWKPKRDLDEVLKEIVVRLNLTTPLGPSQVPNIFGFPAPAQPPPPPPEEQEPPETPPGVSR